MSFINGHTPWNKGKKTGVIPGSAFKSGQTSLRKGKKHTEESKAKMSNAKTGKKLSKEIREKMSQAQKARYDRVGRKKYKRYIHLCSDKKYKQWRNKVFERDNWICQTCGAKSKAGTPVYLEAHHIKSWADFPKLRYEINNGVTLCKECHKLTR